MNPQANRPLALTTAAWADKLLITGMTGTEGLSQLFQFQFDFVTENPKTPAVKFDQLLGTVLTARITHSSGKSRFFTGICNQFVQGASDDHHTAYQATVVPKVWLLTRVSQSRIFQQMTVPDILRKVFSGYPVKFTKLAGNYYPRDYCVQYRETDFNFACRLMEEEGIYYYFTFADGQHEMFLADHPGAHPDMETGPLAYVTNTTAANPMKEFRVWSWAKRQDLRSGKYTLWDHTFERPHENLQAQKPVQPSVKVGQVEHPLKVGGNEGLEIYEWPGEYAQRFDGIAPDGGERPADLKKIDEGGEQKADNQRTTKIRMEQETTPALVLVGTGDCSSLFAGGKFPLKALPDDKKAQLARADGEYVVTTVTHYATGANAYRAGAAATFGYHSHFTCIPAGLPFRPARATPKPFVQGTQTAVVVGPPGEEIFTDKFGRIKVQFHWDRAQKKNADSSCWIRYAHLSAGRHWGSFHLPRIGQEVIIDFQEGDPDQPICLGSVYNPDQMPMYKLPDEKTKSYIRTNTSMGGVGYHEIRFEDKAGQEQIYVHSQRNMDTRVRNDCMERIGNDRHLRVGFYLPNDHKGDLGGEQKKGSQFEEVAVNQHLKVHSNQDEHVGGDVKFLVGSKDKAGGVSGGNYDIHLLKDRKELVDGTSDLHVVKAVKEKFDDTYDLHIHKAVTELYDDTWDVHTKKAVKHTYDSTYDFHTKGKATEKVDGDYNLTVGGANKVKVGSGLSLTVGDYQAKSGAKYNVEASQEIHLKAGMKLVIEAPQVCLKGAGGFVTVGPAGVAIQGTMVLINSGGAAVPGGGAKPAAPASPADAKDAKDAVDAVDAKPVKPKDADHSKTGEKSN